MAVVDFTDWATPSLELALGGVTYEVAPPDVERAKVIVALAARAEVSLKLAPGPVPDEVQAVIDALGDTPLADITLSKEVHQRLVDDGRDPATILRMAYYALFVWARGRGRADALALSLWQPRDDDDADGGDASGG